jgi:hypothetical protein
VAKLTSKERSRLGSPITARQKVEKQIAELVKSEDAEADERPLTKLKQTEASLADALQKVHRLEEQLRRKDDGSLIAAEMGAMAEVDGVRIPFDWDHDRVTDIAKVLLKDKPDKTRSLYEALGALLGITRQAPETVQVLIEVLDPLFEEASTTAKRTQNATLGTAGLRLKILLEDIANRGRKFLNELAISDETIRLTPGLRRDKKRRERAGTL